MLRRLHSDQPEGFAFTPANQAWAEAQITKYPEGRQASAIIPLLWRAQEQEGWLSRPAIEHIAEMLDLAHIRALEVATFYFMFHLQPVGSVAHVQVCGTTSCMICGAEDLVAVCQEQIAPGAHEISPDGKLSWEEVECLGACSNAPMAQIGKDYYEDLTAESLASIIDEFRAGRVPRPGSQTGRYAAEPLGGLTSLTGQAESPADGNASVARALDLGDTVKRIDGTEVPLTAPWRDASGTISDPDEAAAKADRDKGPTKAQMEAGKVARPASGDPAPSKAEDRPAALEAPRDGSADDLKRIKGIGPKLEALLNALGIYHFDQIADWTGAELAWVDDNLEGFKGRASRDAWVAQAKTLASGGAT